MLLQILKGTPTWVFVLFAVLIALGVVQSRPRSLGLARIALLPAAFIAFSFYGVVAAFGARPEVLAAWALGIGAAVVLGRLFRRPSGARWEASTGTFHVPGSWAPLALMMTVFFARYAIAVAIAMNPGLAREDGFTLLAGLAYGLLSGAFLARALGVLSLRPGPLPDSVQST